MLYPSFGGRIFTAADIAAGASPVTISANGYGTPIDSLYSTNYPNIDGTIQTTGNFGLYQRTKQWGYNVDNSNYTALLTKASCQTLLKDYFESDTTNHAKVWRMLCHIKLRHISDLFQNMCVSRGLYYRFIINMNVGTAVLTSALQAGVAGVTGAGGYTGAYGTPAVTTYTLAQAPATSFGATFPLTFASAQPGEPNYFLDRVGSKTWYVGCGIVRYTQKAGGASYTTPATFSHDMNTVRLYVPAYSMSAQAESSYLEMNSSKTIIYEDVLQYNIQGVASKASVNQLITNGVVSPTRVLIVPIFSAATAGNGTTYAAAHQSPFSSEPGSTSPLCSITNLQCLLAGQTVFQIQQQYTFANFVDNISRTGLNGGTTDSLSSGLIDFQSWQNMYQYYLIDVERRCSGPDAVVPKSIQLLFQNMSERTVDYYVFVGVRRSITINLANGTLLA